MKTSATTTLLVLSFLLIVSAFNIIRDKKFDLGKLEKENKLKLVNRKFTSEKDNSKSSVKLDENAGEGLAWLTGETFSEGTIEVDLKGKDAFQKSFLGIAFHGVNDSTYDAIYFRPFNFHSTDSVRKIHAVQYISHPQYPWKKLREERNGQFEKAVNPAPDPNAWFHARIEVKEGEVKVYVENSADPSLSVKKLNDRKTGKIGLWVGDGAGGEFANLKLTER